MKTIEPKTLLKFYGIMSAANWKVDSQDKNIFHSDELEMLRVFPDCIQYWEDIRVRKPTHEIDRTLKETLTP